MSVESNSAERILVALSGSTSSYLAAQLLKTQGYDVAGLFIDLAPPPSAAGSASMFRARCQRSALLPEIQAFCRKSEIPLSVVNGWERFEVAVVDPFLHDSLSQRKPSPCTRCNSEIKLKLLIEQADRLGCARVATAHHAQVFGNAGTGIFHLMKSVSVENDESYLLFGLDQSVLSRLTLPLGGIPAHLLQKLAISAGFSLGSVQPKTRSLCFVGTPETPAFVEARTPPVMRRTGLIYTEDENIVGSHDGFFRYSIGQKEGLQLTVKPPEDWFVTGFDEPRTVMHVGPESDLYAQRIQVSGVRWTRPINQFRTLCCQAKIDPKHSESPAQVELFEQGFARVWFETPQRAITPGQAVVFYGDQEVLGGGWIEKVLDRAQNQDSSALSADESPVL